MTLYQGADASREPIAPLPPGVLIVAGYVGASDLPGPPDTPHIWTLTEWNLHLSPDSPVYRPGARPLPIFTHNYDGDPVVLAQNAADAVRDLGWSDQLGRIIVWDSEFFSGLRGLRYQLNKRGFRLMTYEQTVLQDPDTDFRWIFQLGRRYPPTFLPPGWDGWQWTFGLDWDRDVFSQAVYDGCGRGPRKVEP